MNKVQKQLHFNCSACSATFQLLEIHQEGNKLCREECREHWQALLNHHYQEQIILHLAQQEAKKEAPDD